MTFLLIILSIFIQLSIISGGNWIVSHLGRCNNCNALEASLQILLGAFTAPSTALHDFCFVKIINPLYGLCHFKAWDLSTALFNSENLMVSFIGFIFEYSLNNLVRQIIKKGILGVIRSNSWVQSLYNPIGN